MEFTGTNISSTNKVTDVFAVADAAPIATNGSKGTTLGEVTANAGTVNFPATPAGTGLNAREVQLFVGLEGTSDASPYIETTNVYVKTNLPTKYKREFLIDVFASASGSVNPMQQVLDNLETLISAATDSSVIYGEETTAIVMEPWRYDDGPILYENKPQRTGTVNEQTEINTIILRMVDV